MKPIDKAPTIHSQQQRGFTLVELSIVLVIIGLIIGGILVGRELIKAGEIRKTISEFEKTNTAVNTFRVKYNCLAGDCANATNFFGAGAQPDQVTNGNGNGVIGDVLGTQSTFISIGSGGPAERSSFFDHLAAAEMINLATFDEDTSDFEAVAIASGYPKTPIGKGFIAYAAVLWSGASASEWIEIGGHAYLLGIKATSDGWLDTVDSSSNGFITAPDAYSIDYKLDDGRPRLGKVRALAPQNGDGNDVLGSLSQPAAPGSGSCASNASGEPYSPNIADTCALSIKASF